MIEEMIIKLKEIRGDKSAPLRLHLLMGKYSIPLSAKEALKQVRTFKL